MLPDGGFHPFYTLQTALQVAAAPLVKPFQVAVMMIESK
jgi:hypothetical protein